MMLYTTLNDIKKNGPCGTARDDSHGFRKLLTYLSKTKSDNEQLSFKTILESNGLEDAIWCLRAVDGYDREIRLFAVACARRVEHLDPTGQAKKTNDASERYANGLATAEELKAARDASWDASRDAARNASQAAARDASQDASQDAARDASWDAARAAAWSDSRAVSRAAAWDAARGSQKEDFIKMFCTDDDVNEQV